MIHNIVSASRDLWLQQKVSYDNLGESGVARLRAELRRRSERFLRDVDRLLARYDRDRNPNAPGGERRYAGLGVYYFESAETRIPAISKGDNDGAVQDATPGRDAADASRRVRRGAKRHRNQ